MAGNPAFGRTRNTNDPNRTEKTRGNNGSNGQIHVKQVKDKEVMSYQTAPTFGQWLKASWVDLLTLLILGLIAMLVSILNSQSPFNLLTVPRSTF